MRLPSAVTIAALALATALPAVAQQPSWTTRCIRELNKDRNDAETGKYVYQTLGKDAAAAARANFDFTASGGRGSAVYPTAAKDLMNPFSGASIGLGYFTSGDFKAAPTLGQISMRAIGKDFQPIPGDPVEMRLVIDGKAFGPYPYKDSAKSDGMYSVWLDTADTDGDSKPPILKPEEFAALAKAVDAMKSAEVVFAQKGVDIVKMPIGITKRVEWRDGLAAWAQYNARSPGTVSCPDQYVN